MPTGYTAKIVDGEITSFSKFAQLCVRNFGAAMHMRDHDLSVEYEEAKPSSFYKDEIGKAAHRLTEAKLATNAQLVSEKETQLAEEKTRLNDSINKANELRSKLIEMLAEAHKYNPPTPEHVGIRNFMIDQLKTTFDYDCNTEYAKKRIIEIDVELLDLDADKIREQIFSKAKKDFAYYTEQQNNELDRIQKSNEWVKAHFKAIGIDC